MSVRDSTRKKWEGKVFPTTKSGNVVVLEVLPKGLALVRFYDTEEVKIVTRGGLKVGVVRGSGYFKASTVSVNDSGRDDKKSRSYKTWSSIVQRCYNDATILTSPTYSDVFVSDEWLIYSNFKAWFDANYVEGWHVDKDIINACASRLYSEENCAFVPQEINSLLLSCTKTYNSKLPQGVILNCTGTMYRARVSKRGKYVSLGTYPTKECAFEAYREAKVEYIRELADKWRDSLDRKVYESLYTIEPKYPYGYGRIE